MSAEQFAMSKFASRQDRDDAMLAEIERLRAEVAGLKAENAHARDCLNSATTLLTGIHSLMYPPEITTAGGRVMVFRPKSIDPHETLQGLSDRIRALPDELAALAARKGSHADQA